MAEKPLFTIVIPTLGKVHDWMQAIHSVLVQTNPDWEVIAIDSGDESISRPLIEKLSDSRLKYVNTSKGNPRLNWDTGFRHSSGEYILWLDDDNYLLPHALATFSSVIQNENHPDVVTGEHMHYRGADHYIEQYRNQLVIQLPLFTNTVTRAPHRDVVRRLMGHKQLTDLRARFHTSANFVHRRIVQALVEKIGAINFETTSTHTLRLGMVALAESVYYIDSPIALIGQSGRAMTDTWPLIDSPVLKEVKYTFSLSPLSATTYANYRLENILQTKAKLAEALKDIEINREPFVDAYRRELVVFPQSWKAWFKNWRELTRYIFTQMPASMPLRASHPKYLVFAFGIQLAKTLHLYKLLQKLFVKKRVSSKANKVIPLNSYGVTNIQTAAEALPSVIEREMKVPYATFIEPR